MGEEFVELGIVWVVLLDFLEILLIWDVHLHGESNCAAFAQPFWVYFYIALVCLHKTLADDEAHATSFNIDVSCAFQFTKQVEQLRLIGLINTFASVQDWDCHDIIVRVEGWDYHYCPAIVAELYRVFDQIDEHLS